MENSERRPARVVVVGFAWERTLACAGRGGGVAGRGAGWGGALGRDCTLWGASRALVGVFERVSFPRLPRRYSVLSRARQVGNPTATAVRPVIPRVVGGTSTLRVFSSRFCVVLCNTAGTVSIGGLIECRPKSSFG